MLKKRYQRCTLFGDYLILAKRIDTSGIYYICCGCQYSKQSKCCADEFRDIEAFYCKCQCRYDRFKFQPYFVQSL